MSKKIFIPTAQALNDKIEFFYNIGEPYEVERTGNSILLKKNGLTYYTNIIEGKDRMPLNQVYFISKVKRYIEKHNLHTKPALYSDRSVFRFLDWDRKLKAHQSFNDCLCVDIDSAYWKTALWLGYISQELYDEGLTMDKRIRLASLGSYAKKRHCYKFTGKGNEKFVKTIQPKNPQVFFNCAYVVYKLMAESQKLIKNDFIFYWTDGIYVKNKKAADKCTKLLKDRGYDSSLENLKKIAITNEKILVYETLKKKPRPYSLRVEAKKKNS